MQTISTETAEESKVKAGDPQKRIPAIIKLLIRGNIRLAHTLSTDSRRRDNDNEQVRLLHELTTYMSGNASMYPNWMPPLADLIQRKSCDACVNLEDYLFEARKFEESEFCALICEHLAGETEATPAS